MAWLSVASLSLTEPPCAYVVGQVGARPVATPALIVFVSPEEARAGTALPEPGEAGTRCSSEGVSTPAVPIHVSRSIHDIPGAVVEVTSIELYLAGGPVSRPGHVLHLESGEVLIVPRAGDP